MKQTANSGLKDWNVKIGQEPDRKARELQIRDQLGFMYREEPFHCFDLDDHAILDEQVDAIAKTEGEFFVPDGDRDLTSDP